MKSIIEIGCKITFYDLKIHLILMLHHTEHAIIHNKAHAIIHNAMVHYSDIVCNILVIEK